MSSLLLFPNKRMFSSSNTNRLQLHGTDHKVLEAPHGSSGSSTAGAKSGVLHCSNNTRVWNARRRPGYIVNPTHYCRSSGKIIVQEGVEGEREEVRLKQKEDWDSWREGTVLTSVRFTFSGSLFTPSSQNKVSFDKAKVLTEKSP